MNDNKAKRVKRDVFNGLLKRKKITTDLFKSLSNLEKLFRDKNYIEAFRTI